MALFNSRNILRLYGSSSRCYTILTHSNNRKTQNISAPSCWVPRRELFWEKDRKAGYGKKDDLSVLQQVKNGYKELTGEVKLWCEEMKELIVTDPILIARPGETDLIWCFNNPAVLNKFITTSDNDHNEGYSQCYFEMGPAGRARFHGYLDTRVPKDGRIKKAGYCAFRSQRIRKSFRRESTYNWTIYNTLVLKVRGDGRSYLLNISCEGYYDITWNDIYHYVLYTRGGPYWQYAKIPFAKFVMGSKGRLQDKQNKIRLDRVTHFGISCGDKIDGPFNLEVEYVGLEFDPTHEEENAYEVYKTEKYIVGV